MGLRVWRGSLGLFVMNALWAASKGVIGVEAWGREGDLLEDNVHPVGEVA